MSGISGGNRDGDGGEPGPEVHVREPQIGGQPRYAFGTSCS